MVSNIKALIARSTSLSDERASTLISADMAANSYRYPQPLWNSKAMESEHIFDESLDEPAVPETVISIAVKSALSFSEQQRKRIMLNDVANGLNDTRHGKPLSAEAFRGLPWFSAPKA
jgi:hypothetical protein